MQKYIRSFGNWYDWLVLIFLIVIIYLIARTIKNAYKNDWLIQKYFVPAIMVKVFGGFAFGFYHKYVFGGGDTFGYYFTSLDVAGMLLKDPASYFRVVFMPFGMNKDYLDSLQWWWSDAIMWHSASNFIVSRFGSILCLFGFGIYIPTCIMFSMLSFVGVWQCFRTFCKVFPGFEAQSAFAFLFFPTVVFWGSGCAKDSLGLGAICALTTCAFNVFVFHRKILANVILLYILASILITVKAYILYSFLPPLLFALLFQRVAHIKSKGLKYIIGMLFMIIFVVGAYFGLSVIMKQFSETLTDNLAEYVASMAGKMNQAGSTYDLGIKPEEVASLVDLGVYFPRAIVAAWFRPWIWESHNIAMLLSSMEGIMNIVLVSLVFIKGKIFNAISVIARNPLLVASFIYALLFCGLVALSTGNFGTLVRYKLPAMPFLIATLLITLKLLNKKKVIENQSL